MKSITIVKQYMEVLKTAIEGVVIIELKIFKDTRGYFFESFSQHEFEERVCKVVFPMLSCNYKGFSIYALGVMRG